MSLEIETDLDIIRKKMKKKPIKNNRGPARVIGKHTLDYDSIHKSKREDSISPDELYIKDYTSDFKVDSGFDVSSAYEANNYFHELELKNNVYECLVEFTDIDFSPEKRRRIPSPENLHKYYELLINKLEDHKYSHLELFTTLSTFFTDNIWNVYRKLSKEYKSIIIEELTEKYDIKEIDEINFL